MPHLPDGSYKGPILYIVHAPKSEAPRFFDERGRRNWTANRKKIIDALNRAAIKKIPVVYEMPIEEAQVKEMIASLKSQPRVIWARAQDIEKPSELQKLAEKEKITPTKIIGYGMYRNICVITGLESMKRAFPQAEVTMLEGAATIFLENTNGQRAKYREHAKRYGIKITKKLGRRHLA